MQKDIMGYLADVKENIRIVEKQQNSGTVECSLLHEIEYDFVQALELIKLFLISGRDSYYGYLMMNLSFQMEFNSGIIAGIQLDTLPPVLVTNPLLLGTYDVNEIIYILCHELDHILYRHPAEMAKANPEGNPERYVMFNYSADAAVNEQLDYEIEKGGSFMKGPSDRITAKVFENIFKLKQVRKLESYQYYYDLIKDLPDKQEQSRFWEFSSFQPARGKEEPKEGGGSGGKTDYEDTSVVTRNNWKPPEPADMQGIGDPEEITDVIREFLNTAAEMMNSEVRSNMSASFETALFDINQPPKVNWKQLLKKYIGTVAAGKHKTKTRMNRRQPERYDLSGSVDEKVIKIVVAVDTSASVSDGIVRQIYTEIVSILGSRKKEITMIECDSRIQRVYRVKKQSDLMSGVQGRGGTAFQPVIDYINANQYFRDSLLIYFTDGFGEYQISKPKTYKNLWVIFGNKDNLSLSEPYGIVINF